MSIVEQDVLKLLTALPAGASGPVTAARKRRNGLIYALVAFAAFLPSAFDWAPGWQAAGLGLLLPGAGFLAWGGAWALLVPVTLGLFWLSCVAWFWAGIVVAPIAVWLGAAAFAGGFAGPVTWAPAPWAAAAATALVFSALMLRSARQRAQDRERFTVRQGFFATSLAEVNERVQDETEDGARELDREQLAALRYVYDRALQPIGEYAGYTIIDQFQPAALRYQINHLGYALSIAQRHYLPNFSGYLGQAQRNLIETYLDPQVWSYWVLESMWGHLNFSNFDPARKDNIMMTGYLGMQVNAYMNASGDRRYCEPGSLTFRLNDRTAYRHDAHSLARSILNNFERSEFCLFPCEPNWVYPVCNMYGMSSLAAYDTVTGSHHMQGVLPRWSDYLEREFVDEKGSIIGLRSYLTGHALSIFASEAGFAFFANIFAPALGRRLWAVGRKELGFCVAPDADGRPRLTFPREATPSWIPSTSVTIGQACCSPTPQSRSVGANSATTSWPRQRCVRWIRIVAGSRRTVSCATPTRRAWRTRGRWKRSCWALATTAGLSLRSHRSAHSVAHVWSRHAIQKCWSQKPSARVRIWNSFCTRDALPASSNSASIAYSRARNIGCVLAMAPTVCARRPTVARGLKPDSKDGPSCGSNPLHRPSHKPQEDVPDMSQVQDAWKLVAHSGARQASVHSLAGQPGS